MYAINVSRDARKALKKYERGDPKAYAAALDTLTRLRQNPYSYGSSVIRNSALRHCEGTTHKIATDSSHRLVYAVIDERKEVYVMIFDHRNDAYKVK